MVLLLAAAVFAPFAVSAALFVGLPPAGTPLEELGYSGSPVGRPVKIVVEPSGRTAWFVLLGYRGTGHLVLRACRVELATGRALTCPLLAEATGGDHFGRLLHAYGEGRLLVLVPQRDARRGTRLKLALLGDASPVLRELPGAWSAAHGDGSEPLTLTFDAKARRFELFAATTTAPIAGQRVRIAVDGQAGPLEPVRLPAAHPPGVTIWTPMGALPGDPARVVLFDLRGYWLANGAKVTRLGAVTCTAAWARSCLVLPSTVQHDDLVLRWATSWLDASGTLQPLADGGPAALGELRRTLVERVEPSGALRPVLGWHAVGGAEEAFRTRLPSGELLTAAIRVRGSEQVLLLSKGSGPARRVAREAHTLGDWTFVPWKGGLFALQRDRALPLDLELRPVVRASRLANLGSVLAERFRLAAPATAIYLASLLGFPILAVWALRRLAGQRRAGSVPVGGPLVALVCYVLVAGLLLLDNWRFLFPP